MSGNNPGKPRLDPRLGLAIGTAGVSSSSILIRLAEAPSLVTATLRLVLTVAILTPLVLARHRGELKGLARRDVLMCCLSGFFLALHFLFWFESLNHTTVAIGAALVNTDSILTAIGFALILKGRIPKLGLLAIGLTFAGSLVIALGAGSGGGGQLLGAGLALLGAVFISGYLLIGRVQRGHMSTNVYTWLVYTACMVTLLIFCGASGTSLIGWGGREWLIALGLAVFCTLLGHSMFSWCLGYLTPAYVAAGKLTEPVFAAVMAAILFKEVPAPVQLAGAALVLAGIFLYTLAEGRPTRDIPDQ